MKTQGEIGMAS